jgi:RNA polymerase sigma factor (sigma-70 family)
MAGGPWRTLLGRLRGLAGREPSPPGTDAELLERFLGGRDQAAFAALLQRHGALVWGVCRRMLRQTQDAEDAFQATFLVLVNRGASVARAESLRAWLYGVAFRVAARARARSQRAGIAALPELPDAAGPTPEAQASRRELAAMIDEEVQRLPDCYRLPVVLCYFEGKTNDEAAAELGCSRGTLAARLARARQKLHSRLSRRGLDRPALLPLPVQAVPPPLHDATVRLAALLSAGQDAAVASIAAVHLCQGVLRMMFVHRLLRMSLVVAVLALAGAGTLAAHWVLAGPPAGQGPGSAGVVPPGEELPAKPGGKEAGDPKARPAELALKVVLPDGPVTLADVNSGKAPIKFRLENKSKKEVVVYSLVRLDVRDAKGNAVTPAKSFGSGPPGPLSEIERRFQIIPAGETKDLAIDLRGNFDGTMFTGWKLSEPGTYKLVLTYQYSRKDFKATYLRPPYLRPDEDREKVDRPDRLWNRAMEVDRTLEAELKVEK